MQDATDVTELMDKLDLACSDAGASDEHWNRRFIAALNKHGLYLSWWPEGQAPLDALMAPRPFSQGWQYQYPSYVTMS